MPQKAQLQKNIRTAAHIIRHGGVVIYPTDTAYAIGCDFQNAAAIERIVQIKKRTKRKFTLIASSQQQVEEFFPLNACQKKLAKKYWPGPLSIVLNKQFAVRVPALDIARTLARNAHTLLIATSANISGEQEIYNLHAKENRARASTLRHLRAHVDAMIDIGALPLCQPSTVVQCHDHHMIVHRAGPIIVDESLL